MQANESRRQKRAVEQLNFGTKTSKRATWEAWEFTVIGPHQVEVTNASYGAEKGDHQYTVGIEVRDGVALPAECGCPADKYDEDYDCKHKVALATIGGLTVLNAAVEFEPAESDQLNETETVADKLRTDGGCKCDSTGFPCWECYRTGRRDLPE